MRFAMRRAGFTLIELLVVIAIIAILIALLVPAVQKVRFAAARTQSTNNLKQLALASHAYHDAFKQLPSNGTVDASKTTHVSGSWAYQILPFVDQQPLYDTQPSSTPITNPVATFLCALRGRPGFYTGGTGSAVVVNGTIRQNTPIVQTIPFTVNPGTPYTYNYTPGSYSITINNGPVSIAFWITGRPSPWVTYTSSTSSGLSIGLGAGGNDYFVITAQGASSGADGGPATDFGINPFLNSSTGTLNAALTKRMLNGIQDGSSNTILLGHIYYPTNEYPLTTAASANARLSIFRGGANGTSRNGRGDTAATWMRDGTPIALNQWGSPMSDGGLMALGDGTVRVVPYQTPLTNLLGPDDGISVDLP
jgi:prepilin-type N-terminal cleavage/methylation domain-containing protein